MPDQAGKNIQVFVKSLEGKTNAISINDNSTLCELKAASDDAMDYAGPVPEGVVWMRCGTANLNLDFKIKDYEIVSGQTIYMIGRLRAGSLPWYKQADYNLKAHSEQIVSLVGKSMYRVDREMVLRAHRLSRAHRRRWAARLLRKSTGRFMCCREDSAAAIISSGC